MLSCFLVFAFILCYYNSEKGNLGKYESLSAQHTNKPKLQRTSPTHKFKQVHGILTWN